VMIIKNGWKLIIEIDKKDKTNHTRKPVALFNLKENASEMEAQNLINAAAYETKVKELFDLYNTTRDSERNTNS